MYEEAESSGTVNHNKKGEIYQNERGLWQLMNANVLFIWTGGHLLLTYTVVTSDSTNMNQRSLSWGFSAALFVYELENNLYLK